ncbi:hypothetical protein BJ741DRAFT_614680 [Chytriomyces cf. hyalinus JEL632]|nr:hypothetical protein BJ741DRAFT_614680 [Chytriomyces cf. hyalinus JEL632]
MFALDLLASAALSSRGGSPVPSHEASPALCPAATPLAEHLMDSAEMAPSSGVGLGLSIGVTLPMPHKPTLTNSLPPISSIHQSLPVARAPVLLSSSAGPARQRLYSVTATSMFTPKQAPYVHLQQNPHHHQQQQQQQFMQQQQPGPRIVIGSSPSITPISETFPTSATTASAPTSPTMGSGAAAPTTFRPRSFSVRHVNLVPAPMSTGTTLAYSTNSTAIPPQSVFLASPVTNASAATSPATPTSFNQMHVQSNSSHNLVPQILKQKPLSAISAPITADTPAAAARNEYSCPHCLKNFTRKHHLVSHMVSHSQAAPLKCPIPGCDATFRRNQDRRRHIRKIRHDGVDASVVATALKSCNSMDA